MDEETAKRRAKNELVEDKQNYLANVVKAQMVKLGWTAEVVAEEADVHPNTIRRICDSGSPECKTLLNVLEALGLHLTVDSEEDQVEEHEDLVKLFKRRLESLGCTASATEKEAGLKGTTLRNIFRGKAPKYGTVVKLCQALYMRVTITPLEGPLHRDITDHAADTERGSDP